MKTKKRKILLWAGLSALLLALILFLGKDIIYFYINRFDYVYLNYSHSIQLVDDEVSFEIDLTRKGTDPAEQPWALYATEQAQVSCQDGGALPFVNTNENQVSMMEGLEELDKNYYLHFTSEAKGSPFTVNILLPIDFAALAGPMRQGADGQGGLPLTDYPVEEITVQVGEEIFTPILYTVPASQKSGMLSGCIVGLFPEPGIYERLIEEGETKATVTVGPFYQTTYTIPGIEKLFSDREMPTKSLQTKVEKPVTLFSGTKVSVDQGEAYYGESVYEVNIRFDIKKNSATDVSISSIEPIYTQPLAQDIAPRVIVKEHGAREDAYGTGEIPFAATEMPYLFQKENLDVYMRFLFKAEGVEDTSELLPHFDAVRITLENGKSYDVVLDDPSK